MTFVVCSRAVVESSGNDDSTLVVGCVGDEVAAMEDTSVVIRLSDDDSIFGERSVDVENVSLEDSVISDEVAAVSE